MEVNGSDQILTVLFNFSQLLCNLVNKILGKHLTEYKRMD